MLSLDRLAEVTRADWGWYTTFTDNLAAVGRDVPGLLDDGGGGGRRRAHRGGGRRARRRPQDRPLEGPRPGRPPVALV